MRTKLSVFPKFFQNLDPSSLAQTVRRCGLDTVNLVVRRGFPVHPQNLETALRPYLEGLRQEGLTAEFSTVDYSPASLLANDEPLARLADEGIRFARIGYFSWDGKTSLPEAYDTVRTQLEKLAERASRLGIRIVVQLHHGTLLPNPAAFFMVARSIHPAGLAVEIDPGNQAFEGMENWKRTAHLLRPWLHAMGVKDVIHRIRPDTSHARGYTNHLEWAPLHQGSLPWETILEGLHEIDFEGYGVFMPFYEENDQERLHSVLTEEVTYFRALMKRLQVNQEPTT